MKVSLLQQDISWCNPEENRHKVERMMDSASGADLYVLPEMFTTGFCMEPERMAEPFAVSETLLWMRQQAKERQCALAGSVAVEEMGYYYNRLCFVFPDGHVQHYDKRHLFSYGGEQKVYTPGRDRVIVEYQGVRILLQICYDLRFPVFARNGNDYDLMLYVANWPTSRIAVWDILLKARALENQCYVIGVNRVGNDSLCDYCGHSVALNAYGKEVAAVCEGQECASFTVDMKSLGIFRKKFPVLKDGDTFNIS